MNANVLYKRTQKGKDTMRLMKLLRRWRRAKVGDRRNIEKEINRANHKFRKRWNVDGLVFISRVFS